MSEQHRQTSSPFSASPGRLPSIARPEWPWSARSYTRGASTSSMHSQASSMMGSGHLQASWEVSRSTSSAASSSGTPLPWRSTPTASGARSTPSALGLIQTESTPRQWSFTGLEWVVRDVQRLRDFIEGDGQDGTRNQNQAENFEVLKQSPIMGEKFKLEIASTPHSEETLTPPRQALSIYVTSLMMDFAQGDYEMPASMMAAIRYPDSRLGERGVCADWVWQFWQHDWIFRQESEVWECPLPPLSELLQNPRIQESDSFIICVQIHSPAGPSIPEQPSVAYVPRDLLNGLEASLDNSNTGDVRFICLEKFSPDLHTSLPRESPELDTDANRRPPSSTSTHSTFPSSTTARKRVIYAHSDILTRRSEYFATMLTSAFAEGTDITTGERKVYTVVVEEADFETMYWLLKFCYTNWVLFKEEDDPRAAVEGVGAGWSVKWLASRNGEWDWKTFHKSGPGDEGLTDTRSATSGESLGGATAGMSRSTSGTSEVFQHPTMSAVVATTSTNSITKPPSTSSRQPARRPTANTNTLPIPTASSSTSVRPKPESVTLSTSRYAGGPPKSYPISPRTSRSQPPSLASSPDPHPHPTPVPPPASALSMYQIAHRYTMPGLAQLALEHMMMNLTPQSSFALLLATTMWESLHTLVQDYVIEKWEDVSASDEFEHCCQEIAAGEWGPNGGKTLTAVFRRLRSPSAAA